MWSVSKRSVLASIGLSLTVHCQQQQILRASNGAWVLYCLFLFSIAAIVVAVPTVTASWLSSCFLLPRACVRTRARARVPLTRSLLFYTTTALLVSPRPLTSPWLVYIKQLDHFHAVVPSFLVLSGDVGVIPLNPTWRYSLRCTIGPLLCDLGSLSPITWRYWDEPIWSLANVVQ